MKRSEQINEIAAALSKAQKSFESAERGHVAKVMSKKGEGSSYSFNYADLAAYLDVCRGPLSENGLSFIQEPTCDGNKVSVTTLLMHQSGQWIESDPLVLTLTGETLTPQVIGSGITYARRYSLSAITGMASEQDDDGNAASGNQAATTPREKLPPCPKCGKQSSVIVGQAQYGGGIVCYKKKEGCGHTWEIEGHPFTPKSGEGNVPSDQSNGAKPPKTDPPAHCKEFVTLSNFLRNCGATTPEQATAIVNWAMPQTGDITALRQKPDECKAIFEALKGTNMSGPAILAEATQLAV